MGTEYKQVNAFDAQKRGAAMAARNIARHIEREVAPTNPRAGSRWSTAGAGATQRLAGAGVDRKLALTCTSSTAATKPFAPRCCWTPRAWPPSFNYRVICGPTGSGKTRLLQALAAAGAQVLDLEALAEHRSSVLGLIPGQPQPSQKQFDTRVWNALRSFDPSRVVWAESESKKVGNVSVPDALMTAMRASPCARLELPVEERVQLLMEDYDFFVKDPAFFCARLDVLKDLRGKAVIDDWKARVQAGQVEGVVRELLELHYDPGYASSTRRNYQQFDASYVIAAHARAALSNRDFCLKILTDTAG